MSPGAAAGAAAGAAGLAIAIAGIIAATNDPNQPPSPDASIPGGTWGAHTNVRQDLPPGNMIAGGGPEAMAAAAASSSTTFNHASVEQAIKDGINKAEGHTTVYRCVPDGDSCAEASDRRGVGIANQLRARQEQLGLQDYEITVGNTQGWKATSDDPTGRNSLHIWNTVNFRNIKTGKTVTYDADDYFGFNQMDKKNKPPNWSSLDKATDQELKHKIPPKSSAPSSATTTPPAGTWKK
jgi:hypothetical protein